MPSGTGTDELFRLSAARLNEIGNQAISGAQQNSERLSAMFGVRAAQANPIEASSIETLKQAGGTNNGIVTALAMALANLAHVTPATQAPPTQK
jgi:hypothetical protein